MAFKATKHISSLTIWFGPDGAFSRANVQETERMMDGETEWGSKSAMPREATEKEIKTLLGEQVASFTAAVDSAEAHCAAAEARAAAAEARVAKLEALIAQASGDA